MMDARTEKAIAEIEALKKCAVTIDRDNGYSNAIEIIFRAFADSQAEHPIIAELEAVVEQWYAMRDDIPSSLAAGKLQLVIDKYKEKP